MTNTAEHPKALVPPTLTHAIRQLTEHPEVNRIHKLLYWVYKGKWDSGTDHLHRIPIDVLLQQLVQHTPSHNAFEQKLYKAAALLNKPEKYQKLARLISGSCALFYADTAPEAEDESDSTDLFMTEIVAVKDISAVLAPLPTLVIPDRFELRRRLMQQVPPLKVKILLFSTLRRPFTFKPSDWMELKSTRLDDWLTELVNTFPSIDLIETQLFKQIDQLHNLDQCDQIAEAIVQAIRASVP